MLDVLLFREKMKIKNNQSKLTLGMGWTFIHFIPRTEINWRQ